MRKSSISIKELHAKTGEYVRRAGQSRTPLQVTDRGQLVAMLVSPRFLAKTSQRTRSLIPEYAQLLAKANANSNDVVEDLAAVRGDR